MLVKMRREKDRRERMENERVERRRMEETGSRRDKEESLGRRKRAREGEGGFLVLPEPRRAQKPRKSRLHSPAEDRDKTGPRDAGLG